MNGARDAIATIAQSKFCGISMAGLISMALLVLQGTAISLVLRYSRTRGGMYYHSSVAGEIREKDLG